MNKEAMHLEGLTGKKSVQAITHLLSFMSHAPLDESAASTIAAIPKRQMPHTSPAPKELMEARNQFLNKFGPNRFINNMPGVPS
jgi:hypothetical protein